MQTRQSLILFLSGMSALGYQVLWIRYFSLILGNHIYSFSLVSSFFMLGLSMGSILAYKLIRENQFQINRKRFIVYEASHLLISLSSISLLITQTDFLASYFSYSAFALSSLIVFLFVFPVTFLMGLAFPYLIDMGSSFMAEEKQYGVNTLGASFGVVFFGFVFLYLWGYPGLLVPIGFCSLCAIALVLTWKELGSQKLNDQLISYRDDNDFAKWEYYVLASISGFVIFSLEVLWFRQLQILLGDRAYLSSLILFFVILILGLASLIAHKLMKYYKRRHLAIISILISLLCLWGQQFFLPEIFHLDRLNKQLNAWTLLYIFINVIMPLFSLGMLFPLVISRSEGVKGLVNRISILIGVNSIFSLLGSLISTFIIIELWGVHSLYWIVWLILLFSLHLLMIKDKLVVHMFIFVVFGLAFALKHPGLLQITQSKEILYQKESALTHFTLVNSKESLMMFSGNYRIAAPTKTENLEHAQTSLVYFPLVFKQEFKSVLTMGLGYGVTLKTILTLDPEIIDSVEILQSVLDVNHFFEDINNLAHLNPRVRHHIADARAFLNSSDKQYDLISANISSPYGVGGSYFVTREYYQLVKSKLTEDGIYSQLVWGPHMTEIVHTFASVFDYVALYPGYDEHDFVLLGSNQELKLRHPSEFDHHGWPLFFNQDRQQTIEFASQRLKDFMNQKPRFIISDHRADIIFARTEGMGFLWTYK